MPTTNTELTVEEERMKLLTAIGCGKWDIFPELLHALADEMRRYQAEIIELEGMPITNTGLFCNGCGELIGGWPNVFRCVTPGCRRIYHESCLLAHCAKDLADLTAERDRLKEDLRILTQGRFVQQ